MLIYDLGNVEELLPRRWYNILPDLPEPLPPPVDPRTGQPIDPDALALLFPREILRQEMSLDSYIDIPEEVLDIYRLWRPTPLMRAKKFEEAIGTPAHIYFKFEGVSPTGSHKVNTSVPQAYYNRREGVERLTTETGAGQWGSALAFATNIYDIDLTVYMVRVSYHQKPYRKTLMRIWGADVVPSPSERTAFGRSIVSQDPNNPGSLGIAISEAIEDAVTHDNTKYSLGSVLNHVLLHQTVIGLEAAKQLEEIDVAPDYVVGCVGGGSNFAGLSFPFYMLKKSGKLPDLNIVASESTASPSLTYGDYKYDFGDTAKMTPKIKMYTLGHDHMPAPIHAGGLRYHGAAPTVSLLRRLGIIKAYAYNQVEVFEVASLFARVEGLVPAPETAHAIKTVYDISVESKRRGEPVNILFNFSGHGLLDLKAYEDFLDGKLLPYGLK
jgi:tryptophan synthase beta chain